MTVAAVVGATGFIGAACAASLESAGFTVRRISAPRLTARTTSAQVLRAMAHDHPDLPRLASEIAGSDVVVNAAGISDAASVDWDALCGANALLPCLLAEAANKVGVDRLIHLSTAAVQGRRAPLDESDALAPFSPYSESKALAELALPPRLGIVIIRPTSVHGPSRPMTARLIRLARSRWAAVAGDGTSPTPQVHVRNVAASVALCARSDVAPPRVVLQPWEGWTTASLLRLLGGREPHHVTAKAAEASLMGARAVGQVLPGAQAHVRRLEMLLQGQAQEPGWLEDRLAPKPELRAAWDSLTRAAGWADA